MSPNTKYVPVCEWCGKKCNNGIVRTKWWNHLLVIDDFSKSFCSRRCRTIYQNQKQKEANAKQKTTQPITPKRQRQAVEREPEYETEAYTPIEHRIKTKEEIDLEYYERQKQFEFEQQQQNAFAEKEKAKYHDAKKYLADGGNKFIYYLKLLWAFLDKPWKKILFVLIAWWLIAGMLQPFFKK